MWIHCSSFQSRNVYFNSETSSLHWNLNSGTPWDSKNAFLHCVDVLELTHLCLSSSDRATHDEAMTPHSPVPFGPYPLDLNVFKACLGEPLQHIKLMFLSPQSCIHTTMVWPISEGIVFSISLDRSDLKYTYLTMYRCAEPGDMPG